MLSHPRNINPVMKTIFLICLLIAFRNTCLGADFSLNAGQEYVINFDSFTLLRPTQPGDPSDGTLLGFTGGSYSAKMEFFPNSISDPPMDTETYSHSGPYETIGFGVQFGYAPWPDFQGVVRVTSLSGTFSLDGMRCDEVVSGGYYTTGWIVPEPSVTGMLVAGSALLLAGGARRWNFGVRRQTERDAAFPRGRCDG